MLLDTLRINSRSAPCTISSCLEIQPLPFDISLIIFATHLVGQASATFFKHEQANMEKDIPTIRCGCGGLLPSPG